MANSLKNDVILVRYPFSDLSASKIRPAVAVNALHVSQDLFIVPLTSRTASLLPGEFYYRGREPEDSISNPFSSRCFYRGTIPMTHMKVVIEKHPDGYVAYPLGLKGVIVSQGETYDKALQDLKSAIRFHIETFGPEVFEDAEPVLEAFIAETEVPHT